MFMLFKTFLRGLVVLFLIAAAGGSCIAQQPKAQPPLGVVDQKPAEGHFVEVDGKFLIPYDHQIPGTPPKQMA